MLKDNIRTLRKEKGLSQEELAVKLNVVRQTVSKWEQGVISQLKRPQQTHACFNSKDSLT